MRFVTESFAPLLFLSDGHHLWETEAKVDRDASKSVSDTRDIIVVTNPSQI